MTLNQFIIHLMKNNKMIRIIGEQIGFMGLEMILAIYQSLLNTVSKKFFKIKKFKKKYKN